ncbi:E3 SUMO-protein ligase ZBED1 isoform X3 [Triplophysa rosa]|uniref:E3 SUMO-protein ligase ZBED1 isoform X3 n=1 Tax=Triplophysa rosa TaxID=992332 RepID=UPI0025462EEE|nr:E3 SUMO-protein ligase ZBED1 isoform X3 [Triplophysa rosa]
MNAGSSGDKHSNRGGFGSSRDSNKRSKHQYASPASPYREVYGRQSQSGRSRKGSRSYIHIQPQRSTELQPYNQLELTTQSGNDSDFKTLLLKMVVQPLNAVAGFLCSIKSLQPSLDTELNDSRIQAELQSLYSQKRMEVESAVKDASNLVLSAELWSSNEAMFYLTVSCHLITENWRQKSYVLDTAHLLNEHTPEYVQKQLLRISNEWSITENIQVVVTNVDGMKKVPHGYQWAYLPCFANTLNKMFKETIDYSDWKHLLRKCQRIVAFFHQNNKASESLRNYCFHINLKLTELTQITDLKWLPTLHMLKSILELWPAIFNVFATSRVDDLCLNENERKTLNDIVAVLNLLKKVTENIGNQEYSPISNIIPLVQNLQKELRNLVMMGNRIAQILSQKCDYHIGSIKKNNWFRVSTALDPQYKTCLLNDSGVEDVKTEIRSKMRENTHTVQSRYDFKSEEMILQKYWQINISENPLKFWSTNVEFKQLAPVARKYLTVVSTAIPMECVHQFEKSQIINRRSNLEPKNLSMILFLNAN